MDSMKERPMLERSVNLVINLRIIEDRRRSAKVKDWDKRKKICVPISRQVPAVSPPARVPVSVAQWITKE